MAARRAPDLPAGATRLVRREGTGDRLVLRKARLRVASGPDKGLETLVEDERAAVGTAEGNALRLSDGAASRHHLEIVNTPAGFLVRDLGSTNGTRVDGRRVLGAYLDAAARIEVGETVLKFEPLPQTAEHALASDTRCGELVGQSAAMRRLFAQIAALARSDVTVLLQGESGTGKELCARALHAQGARAGGPLVVVDCGALPANLIESELFGHLAGAFTGASGARAGAFERAEGGTVLLDEVGELPLELQPKLLGVLERRQVQRLGGAAPLAVDVRVVAATNRDLRAEVNARTFRADLYYRLSVVTLEMPPLRERPEDVGLLVQEILARLGERRGGEVQYRVGSETLERLRQHRWPGNVRELRNFVERAVALADDAPPLPAAGAPDAPPPGGPQVETHLPYRAAKQLWVDVFERAYAAALLERAAGNVSAAAREAQMDRAHLIDLLKKHDLKGPK